MGFDWGLAARKVGQTSRLSWPKPNGSYADPLHRKCQSLFALTFTNEWGIPFQWAVRYDADGPTASCG